MGVTAALRDGVTDGGGLCELLPPGWRLREPSRDARGLWRGHGVLQGHQVALEGPSGRFEGCVWAVGARQGLGGTGVTTGRFLPPELT